MSVRVLSFSVPLNVWLLTLLGLSFFISKMWIITTVLPTLSGRHDSTEVTLVT